MTKFIIKRGVWFSFDVYNNIICGNPTVFQAKKYNFQAHRHFVREPCSLMYTAVSYNNIQTR